MENKDIDVSKKNESIERKSDSSLVASTFIKYFAYVLIFFGALYFLAKVVFPMF